jgi:hypothetical protein
MSAETLDQLTILWNLGYRRARHGACIGADDQFGRIAKELGFYVIAHQGWLPTR